MTVEQQQQALARANETLRLRRALRRELAALDRPDGLRLLADVIASPPPWLHTLTAMEALGWARRHSPQARRGLLYAVGVAYEGREIGQLSDRQLAELARLLREKAGPVPDSERAAA